MNPWRDLAGVMRKAGNCCFQIMKALLPVWLSFPLVRNRQLIGCLNIGSVQQERFIQGSATDFLERLAAIVAVCFENAFNHERLKLLGLLDPLTGIHNRRYFDERLDEEISRSLRQKERLSCLFLDIDHFKQFNDIYGHHIGDLVLAGSCQIDQDPDAPKRCACKIWW